MLVAPMLAFYTCVESSDKVYSYDSAGYHYRLITFQNQQKIPRGCSAHISAVFSTQSDSVFWDSRNNYNDRLFLKADSNGSSILSVALARSSLLDSAELLVPVTLFFRQQFNSAAPFFSAGDSVVKVNYKIKAIVCADELIRVKNDLRKDEERLITQYMAAHKINGKADAAGVYWLDGAPETSGAVKAGQGIRVWYKGAFLNGRFLERSPQNFEFIYGAPDQLLPGLNYVIGRLKLGQSVKIILPSRLAFGDAGSSNGTVPPYTPLMYEIKIEASR